MTYPLIPAPFNGNRLHATDIHYSENHVRCMYDFWINIEKTTDKYGNAREFYRFRALSPQSEEEASAYSIECPHCHRLMEQVWGYQNQYDLGLYHCPVCNKKREDFHYGC